MSRCARVGAMVTMLLALAGRPAAAQEHAPASRSNEIDIMSHLGNSHSIELPSWKAPYYTEVELPRFAPIHIGAVTIDLSPTKHAVFLVLAAALVALVFLYTSRVVARAQAAGRPPRGFAAAMEATVLYIRQEVILANAGPHGEGDVNYLLTVFFFILTCDLLLSELPGGRGRVGHGHRHHAAGAVRGVSTGVRVHAAHQRVHRADARRTLRTGGPTAPVRENRRTLGRAHRPNDLPLNMGV